MNVAVLFGGKTCEHEISIITAAQAMAAMAEATVFPVYITQGGKWLWHKNYTTVAGIKSAFNRIRAKKVYFRPADMGLWSGGRRLAKIDAVLPCMHGVHGEDGMIAAICNMAGLPCAESPLGAASLAMSKCLTKRFLTGLGVSTVPYTSLEKGEEDDLPLKLKAAGLRLPLVVKPDCLGSSIGIALAHDPKSLEEALSVAFCYDDRVLIEQAVLSRKEYNCAAISVCGKTVASLVEEVGGLDEVLSFADKYLREGKTRGMESLARRVPAEIDAVLEEKIKALTKEVYSALGCRGVVRVDFLLDQESNCLYVNEINTIPGSLAYYLFPKLGMQGVINAVLDDAVKSHARRESLVYLYKTPAHGKLGGK